MWTLEGIQGPIHGVPHYTLPSTRGACGHLKGYKVPYMVCHTTPYPVTVGHVLLLQGQEGETMSYRFYLSLVFTFLFLLQSLNNDENKFKSTISTYSTLGKNLTLRNLVFIAKYKELDFLLHPNLFYHRSIECLTNNRTNPLEYKPLLCGYNWNFASIQSANNIL